MTKRLNLSPVVTVEYWRNTPVGVINVGIDKADFAIFSIRIAGKSASARFQLPEHAPQLAAAMFGASAAYALGHHHRTNRVRRALGLEPTDSVSDPMGEPDDV